MKSLIVCRSVSHGNTAKVAEVIGAVLGARIVDPTDLDPGELTSYELVGFGSGVRNMDFYRELRDFVRSLPTGPRSVGPRPKAFVFNTSGFPEPPFHRYRSNFVRLVEAKGFDVIDTCSCFGYDTYLPLMIIGGARKGRPNAEDLAAARAFAERLATRH